MLPLSTVTRGMWPFLISLCVHMCTYTSGWMQMHVCKRARGSQSLSLSARLYHSLPILLGFLTESGGLTEWLNWLLSSPRDPLICLPRAGITGTRYYTQPSPWALETELGSSCSHGKHFAEPSPQLSHETLIRPSSVVFINWWLAGS